MTFWDEIVEEITESLVDFRELSCVGEQVYIQAKAYAENILDGLADRKGLEILEEMKHLS